MGLYIRLIEQIHTSPAICCLNVYILDDICATANHVSNLKISRLLTDGMDLDPELFWNNYGSLDDVTFHASFDWAMEQIFPLCNTVYPKSTVTRRFQPIADIYWNFSSPRDLAIYLGFESLGAAYATLECHLRDKFLRVALTQWGFWSGLRYPRKNGSKPCGRYLLQGLITKCFAVNIAQGAQTCQDLEIRKSETYLDGHVFSSDHTFGY